MSNFPMWLLDELLTRHDLRPTRRTISTAELDAISDRYGFSLPKILQELIRLDVSYELPRLGGIQIKLRPSLTLLTDEPMPVTRSAWLPLSIRFGGLYPIGTTQKGALYAVDITEKPGKAGAVYLWEPDTWRLKFSAPSLKDFFLKKTLRGGIFSSTSSLPEVATRLGWIEAFLSGRHAEAARRFAKERPNPEKFFKESLTFDTVPTRALYWLLDFYLLGEKELLERALIIARQTTVPLVDRFCRYLTDVKEGNETFFDDIPEGRAQFFYELAAQFNDEFRQKRLLDSLSPKAPPLRIAEALHLVDKDTAKRFADTLEEFSSESDQIRKADLQALKALALAYANEGEEASALADVLAWEWRHDPWYGTRPGEAERLSYLIHAYRIANQRERAAALLEFTKEKAPTSGAPLSAEVAFLMDDEQPEEAIQLLLGALQIAPGSPELHTCRERLLSQDYQVSWADPNWPAFLRTLAEEAMTGDPAARISALDRLCEALKAREEAPPSSLPFLVSIVESDPAGRPGALRAIAQNPFDEAISVLVSLSKQSENPASNTAAEVLGKFTSDAALDAVAKLLDEDVFVQNTSLLPGLAQGVLQGSQIREALHRALQRRADSHAPALLSALRPNATEEDFETALRYLRPECGRDAGVQAIALLGTLGDKRALPQLETLAISADPVIAHAAQEALFAMGKHQQISSPRKIRSKLTKITEPAEFDRELRDCSRNCAAQIVQIAAGRAAWEKDPARRDELLSIRALALARSGMLRDAIELADVLAWGWRQDPLCGERPGEAERLARLVDAYRIASRQEDRARPLLDFLREKAPNAAAPLAVEIDLLLDEGKDEEAKKQLQEALLVAPGSIWLHTCRNRIQKRGHSLSWADPSWPGEIREAVERSCTADKTQRIRALETLAGAIRVRREEPETPSVLPLPFLVAVAQHDEPSVARAALLAIAAHPFQEAIKVLKQHAEGEDPDLAAISVKALSEIPTAEKDLVNLVDEGFYRQVPALLPAIANAVVSGELLRESLLNAIEREGIETPWLGPWLLRALAPSSKEEDGDLCISWLSPSYSPELRKASIELLHASKHPRFSELVTPLTTDDDEKVAQAAHHALNLPKEKRRVS